MSKTILPKITLVGAGPGDPELISVKGLKAIKEADVILYDALVNVQLLNESKSDAIVIYVGKRKGEKEYEQSEINKLIVSYSLTHGHVVRLKGGDSFVFGRGSEELEYAHQFGIETHVVPGISSSISVPALAGIPVTHRGVSNSFTVITGTLSDGSLNPEIENALQLNGTLVILMGLSKLKEIQALYNSKGKQDTSVAVISNGSLPEQRAVFGNFNSILEEVKAYEIKAPGIIVIGEVVNVLRKNKELIDQLALVK
jgi:uroporphyrin-III C-methyltransferase